MDLASFDAPRCGETAGFLFSHNCTGTAAYQCDLCGKAVCASHRTIVAAADLEQQGVVHGAAPGSDADSCTSCAKRVFGSIAAGGTAHSARPAGHDDPYWYSGHYGGYGSYGHGRWGSSHMASSTDSAATDSSDFTEADGESLRQEGDASYEMEASGS